MMPAISDQDMTAMMAEESRVCIQSILNWIIFPPSFDPHPKFLYWKSWISILDMSGYVI